MNINNKIIENSAFLLCVGIMLSLYCVSVSWLFDKTEQARVIEVNTSSSERKLIVIDPGHGGEDGGTVGVNGVLEKDLNLSLSQALETILEFTGYEVVRTRTEDKLLYNTNEDFRGKKKILDLKGRLEIAQKTDPDLFIGIHMNAFPEQKYSGLSVYYSKNSPESKTAAEMIRSSVKSSLQPNNNREIKAADSSIYILNRITCPAVLIECGFLSNAEECEKLSTYEYRRELSIVFYSSLVSFLEK